MQFKENNLNEAIELLKTLVTETRKEEGCLQYDLVEDRDTPSSFLMIEEWETEAHHSQHIHTEHFQYFMNQGKPLMMADTKIYRGYSIL
jgi:quinol monooxygenase YgiN